MSYLRFWPTFSTSGLVRAGRIASRTAFERQDLRAHRPPDREVIGDPRLPGEREADGVGPERVEGGGLGVEAELGLLGQGLGELAELLGGVDQPIVGLPGGLDDRLGVDDLLEEAVEPALRRRGS